MPSMSTIIPSRIRALHSQTEMYPNVFFIVSLFFTLIPDVLSNDNDSKSKQNTATGDSINALFSIEGKVTIRPEMYPKPDWYAHSRILLDYGKYIGFVKQDGSFMVNDLPSGSYILEVENADFLFESFRIDITNKGKIRARKLNLLQPNAVMTVPYPVKISARQPMRYFRKREEWRVTDVLMNPMIIMLIVAFLLMLVTPKLAAQDPQMQKEIQNIQLPKVEMPDVSDMLANVFGSKKTTKKSNTLQNQHFKRTARQS